MGLFSLDSVINEFEAQTKDAVRVQRETLQKILEENAEAEYLRDLGLAGRTDLDSFRSCVPLITHKDIEGYIQRIADGEKGSILTGEPITSISLSSGTTQGKPKYVPFNDALVRTTMQIYKISFAYRNREFPFGKGKALQFIYGGKPSKTKGDLTAATATTNVYRSKQFKSTMADIRSPCTSPDEVIFGSDFNQSLYCHLLCGLIFSDEVQVVFSTFAHGLVHAFRALENLWEELCDDIRQGTLSSRITVPSMREAVSALLRPNPDLADSIRERCGSLSNWYGVIPSLWPNAKYVNAIMTGAMEPYIPKLRHYAGELPLVCSDYGASEGWIGANVLPRSPPETATFAVLPDIAYFEFIPLEGDGQGDAATAEYKELEPVGIEELVVGREYEVVVTNFTGLYRYRLGDVVKIAGFYNSTPLLQFVCRRSLLLTVNIDKNTEKDLQLAVEEAGKLVAAEKREIVDFTSYVDRSPEPGRYVIFWELSGDPGIEVLQSCSDALDRAFVDAGYMSSRKSGNIAPLELRVLRRGTFHKVLDHYLGLGAAVSQFKTPRCIGPANARVLQILCDNVEESYFSTAYN